jgi:3-hydroxy acid dehydrogenase/malonic semialdehyde reductase
MCCNPTCAGKPSLSVAYSPEGSMLVTGASSGIGRAVCEKLLEEGWRVIGISRSIEARPLQHELFTALAFDLCDFEQTAQKLKPILKIPQAISGIVFCAGAGYFGSLEQLDFKKIQALITLNLLSPMYLSKLLIPYFKAQSSGRLVYIGSEAALQGAKKGTAYCASKFGLRGFVQALSAECRQAGLNISLINPGMVDTPFFDELDFKPGAAPSNHIPLSSIAHSVYNILCTDANAVIEELNLMPRNRVLEFNKPK